MLKKSHLGYADPTPSHNLELNNMGEISVAEYLSDILDPSRAAELGVMVDAILQARKANSAGIVSKIWRWAAF